MVHCIRLNGKTDRQFRNFVKNTELKNAPKDVSWHCPVRWLSTSDVLHKFLNLLKPIQDFLLEKKHFPQLENDEWLHDLMFFTDVLKHLQTLNLAFQEKII